MVWNPSVIFVVHHFSTHPFIDHAVGGGGGGKLVIVAAVGQSFGYAACYHLMSMQSIITTLALF